MKALGMAAAAAVVPMGCDRRSLAPTDAADDGAVARTPGMTVTAIPKDFSPACGVVPPMVTPFRTDKSVDWPAFERLVEWHVERGVRSIFLVSGSAEFYHITEDEAIEMAQRALTVVDGAVPVLAGATNHMTYTKDVFYQDQDNMTLWDADLAANKTMMQRMEQTGVKGIFITIPQLLPRSLFSGWSEADFYTGNADSDDPLRAQLVAAYDAPMLDYHTELHDAVSCDVYGYEKPGNVIGYKFSSSVFASLGALPRFIAIKDTTCDVAAVQAKVEAAQGTIYVMDANVPNLYQTLQVGACGCVNTTSNVAPHLFAKLCSYMAARDTLFGSALNQRILQVDSLLSYGYMKSAKIALAKMGLPIEPVTREADRTFSAAQLAALDDMVELIRTTEREHSIPPTSVAYR